MANLDDLVHQAKEEISAADNLKILDDYRVLYLGKKGKLTEFLKSLGQLPPEERPVLGQKVNQAKQQLQEVIEQRVLLLQKNQIAQQLASDTVYITLPGRCQSLGSIHPVTKTRDRIEELFIQMGFSIMDGP